jgi:uncharacterized coiled-coil protein SlyX
MTADRASVGEVRAWAKQNGFSLGDRGRLPSGVWEAWDAAHVRRMPAPRAAAEAAVDRSALDGVTTEVADLRARLDTLQRQVDELVQRLAAVEQRPPEPRRLFARTR